MRARPLVLVGASMLAAVHARLDAALQSWRSDWGIDALVGRVSCARAWEAASATATTWLCQRFFDGARGSIRLERRPGAAKLLQDAMFPADSCHVAGKEDGAIAGQAGEQALTSLAERIAGLLSLAPDDGSGVRAWVEQAFSYGSGAVLATIELGGQTISCLLDPAAVEALQAGRPSRPISGLDKVSLAKALGKVAVSLPVTVGHAEVDLGSLVSLAVGDVIRLDAPIEKPLAVCTADGKRLLEVSLGRAGRDLAVEVVGRGKQTF